MAIAPSDINYLEYQNQLLKAEKQTNEARESLSGAERRRREVEIVVASLKDLHGNYNAYYYYYCCYYYVCYYCCLRCLRSYCYLCYNYYNYAYSYDLYYQINFIHDMMDTFNNLVSIFYCMKSTCADLFYILLCFNIRLYDIIIF